ncbi:hypothetical protein Micbo1qcDRAFT_208843 [Microdochium bolleyi]|uniref:Uncharacterized protein n=1 Tax=Microdochium bolleyi TaxID=196109 RepID=A0A136IPQ4_9PEZI|nr:hypothetical protein Micbo1qcDRAFT_208843 [Microdochium bolleyi]
MLPRVLTRASAIRPIARQAAMVPRSFTTSSIALKHKETSDPNSSEYDPEKHKQDSLAKQKSGKGHWKPELASESEEAVKADRNADEDISTLQERTKKAAEENSKAGTSMRDGL